MDPTVVKSNIKKASLDQIWAGYKLTGVKYKYKKMHLYEFRVKYRNVLIREYLSKNASQMLLSNYTLRYKEQKFFFFFAY